MAENARITRRTLLGGAALLAAGPARAATSPAHPVMPRRNGPVLAFVGSYTNASTPAGHGEGITVLRLDPGTARLTPIKVFPNPSPSWLATSADHRFLYAVNEIDSYGADKTGSVTAFAVDPASGDLRPLNTVSSRGKGPAHGSVHPSGKFFMVANYGTGNVAVLPIQPNGALGEAIDVQQDSGPHGATRPAEGPPGNFSISDHDGPHAHMIASDPTGRFVLVNDLGLDLTFVWQMDVNGKLVAANPPFIPAASAGAGPRHFAFHPNGRVLYNLYEEASQLVVYDWNPQSGAATLRQKVSTLPGYEGTNFTSEILVTPDGRFLYVGNRLHNTIGIFAIAADGRVRWLGEEWTRGDYTRNIALDPSGTVMVACNHRSDQLTVFRRDPRTGGLRFTNQYVPIGSPSMILFPG